MTTSTNMRQPEVDRLKALNAELVKALKEIARPAKTILLARCSESASE